LKTNANQPTTMFYTVDAVGQLLYYVLIKKDGHMKPF